jgi:excisionase family DNA binding protein
MTRYRELNGEVKMDESVISKKIVTWMNTSEAAEYLSISKGRLLNLASQGVIPVYKLGRSNRYRKEELDEILISTRKAPRGE